MLASTDLRPWWYLKIVLGRQCPDDDADDVAFVYLHTMRLPHERNCIEFVISPRAISVIFVSKRTYSERAHRSSRHATHLLHYVEAEWSAAPDGSTKRQTKESGANMHSNAPQ